MKLTRLFALAALLVTALSARAEVVIYKGVLHTHADFELGSSAPPASRTYLVVDYKTREIGLVLLSESNGKKTYIQGIPNVAHITEASLRKGKTATIISAAGTYESGATDYSESMTMIRGTNSSLTLTTTPSVVQVNHPRFLTTSALEANASTSGGHFLTENGIFTLDAAGTKYVNTIGATAQEALDFVGNDLNQKGYSKQ